MVTEENIKKIVENSRKIWEDGSLVIYDLTSNLDNLDSKYVAKALSEVFFEKDAMNWFKIEDGERLKFEPTYKVRFVFPESHAEKIKKTVDNILQDIKDDETSGRLKQIISKNASEDINVDFAMAAGSMRSLLFRHSEKKSLENYIDDDLFTDMLENIEIRSLDNKDLMDWKKLPL